MRGLWIGNELGTFERLCIQSFLDHGHPFRLFTYGDMDGIPEGTIVEDANSVLSEGLLRPFQRKGASVAHFADWFRWKLLQTRGGYWVDMDIVCLRPFEFQAPVIFCYQDPFTPSIGVLRFPAEHPVTKDMLERCENPNRVRSSDSWRRRARKLLRRMRGGGHEKLGWGEAGGPPGFREALADTDYHKYGLPFTVFYPVHHQHWPCIFDETLTADLSFFADTHALHLWGELFRRFSPKGSEDVFPPESVFEQLKRKHLQVEQAQS